MKRFINTILSVSIFATSILAFGQERLELASANLNDEIKIREILISSLKSQVTQLELDESGVATTIAVIHLAGIGLGLSSSQKIVKYLVAGFHGLLFVNNGTQFLIAKAKLPELRMRLEEEEAYTEILKARRNRLQ